MHTGSCKLASKKKHVNDYYCMWAEGKHKHLPHVMPPAATGIRTTKYIIKCFLINDTDQVSSD